MKKLVLILGVVLAAPLFSVMLPCGNQVFAVSGCCKERKSEGQPWFNNGKNFSACRKLNQRVDGDKILRQTGRYWWDVGC